MRPVIRKRHVGLKAHHSERPSPCIASPPRTRRRAECLRAAPRLAPEPVLHGGCSEQPCSQPGCAMPEVPTSSSVEAPPCAVPARLHLGNQRTRTRVDSFLSASITDHHTLGGLQQEFTLFLSWEPGAGKARMLPLKALGNKPSWNLPSFWWLRATLGVPWLVVSVSWPSPSSRGHSLYLCPPFFL